MTVDSSIRLLNVDDNEDDAHLLRRHLKKSELSVHFEWVDDETSFLEQLVKGDWDLIISDYSMPSFNGLRVLELVKEHRPEIPVIIMSGAVGEELAVETMRSGARDFILKNSRSRLVPAIIREITEARSRLEKRKAENALDKQHTILRLSHEAARVGSWGYDPNTQQLLCSQSMKTLCGYQDRNGNATLDDFVQIIHQEDRERFSSTLELSISEKLPFIIKHRVKTGGGKLKWFESRAHYHPEEDGEARIIGISIDITELVDGMSALRTAKEKAEESDHLKSAFLANISHELRTPLNAIIGLANLLKDDVSDELESMKWAAVIHDNGKHLLDLINDIVDSAKIESGEIKAEIQQFELPSLLEQIRDSFSTDTKLQTLEGLNLEIPPRDTKRFFVCTDHRRLRQILLNLIRNAIKFTDEGEIRFGYRVQEPEHIQFFVTDSGIGIPKEKQKIIFERFRQVDQSMSRGFQGAGLGLSISRGLTELLGGDLEVESESGKGSSFYFTLPCLATKENSIEAQRD